MSKVKVRVFVKTNQEEIVHETTAIKIDELIKYKEKDSTTVIFDKEKNTLVRENNEIKMKYFFQEKKESTGIIEIKEMQKEIEVKIYTEKIRRKYNDIEIIFHIEENTFVYHIEVLE